MIGVGVHMYVCGPKIIILNCTLAIDSPFRRIYRLALPLLSPEMLSSLSKLRIFLFKYALCSICPKDGIITQSLNSVGKYRHLVNWPFGTFALEVRALYHHRWQDQTTSRIIAELGKNLNVRSSAA